MSIQTIIDNAVTITFDRRKVVGQTVSRSGKVKIGSIASHVPWVMSIEMHPGLRYSTNRALTEEIDRLDRVFTETINIGNTNPQLSYITQYQGDFTPTQISQMEVFSASALEMVFDMANVVGDVPADVVFKKGDFVSVAGGYKYPYTVTADVTRGATSTITVPINRPFITDTTFGTVVGSAPIVGSDVTWNLVMTKKPSYAVVPYDRLEFNGVFELVEVIE
jgi:hypothetical protein